MAEGHSLIITGGAIPLWDTRTPHHHPTTIPRLCCSLLRASDAIDDWWWREPRNKAYRAGHVHETGFGAAGW